MRAERKPEWNSGIMDGGNEGMRELREERRERRAESGNRRFFMRESEIFLAKMCVDSAKFLSRFTRTIFSSQKCVFICTLHFFLLPLRRILKEIHNKDYSVVKTFRVELRFRPFFVPYLSFLLSLSIIQSRLKFSKTSFKSAVKRFLLVMRSDVAAIRVVPMDSGRA